MRSSMREVHALERRAQSRPVGVRCAGSLASSAPISSRDKPTRWAKTMNAMRRSARAREAPVAGARPLGPDQPARLVEAQRRGGDAAPARNLLNREQVIHSGSLTHSALDFKLTLTCRVRDRMNRTLRVAITGGTSGLGLALVRELCRRGARVAFVARTRERVDRVARDHPGTHGIVGDVARKEDIHPIALQISAAPRRARRARQQRVEPRADAASRFSPTPSARTSRSRSRPTSSGPSASPRRCSAR